MKPWEDIHLSFKISKTDVNSLNDIIKRHNVFRAHEKRKNQLLAIMVGVGIASAYIFYKKIHNLMDPFTFINLLFTDQTTVFILSLIIALVFFTKREDNKRKKKEDEFHSLRRELIALKNKEWHERYGKENIDDICMYLKEKHDINLDYYGKMG
ncbi:YpbF family protein [Bacillus timonensis]|nr:YpbF family protein [Bacillus timonensis]